MRLLTPNFYILPPRKSDTDKIGTRLSSESLNVLLDSTMKLRKRKTTEIELSGQDSFLDLVSNIVGILIILVMVAGIRAQYSSANIPEPVGAQTMVDLDAKYQVLQTKEETAAMLRHSVEELNAQSQVVAEQIYRQSQEYAALFDFMTSARAGIEFAAEEKSQSFKEKIDLQRQLLETNAKLEQLDKTKQYFLQVRPQATVLENIPTPLAKTVEEKEIHFRLLGGRIAYVPFAEFQLQLWRHVSEEQNRYSKQRSNVGKIGPIENFDLDFILGTYNFPMIGSMGTRIELEYAEFVPRYEPLGQPLPEALASPQSEFRRKLSQFRRDIYTVTVWVYPDSFKEYQVLKQFLTEQGYAIAARPMSKGHLIGISPYGTKSSSQ